MKIGLLKEIPYPLTQGREDFARKSSPYYEKYFPEILDELSGLAKAQDCNMQDLCTLLFSMYAIQPINKCSSLAIKTKNHTYIGRNSDFIILLEALCSSDCYHLESSNSFIGNTTSFTEMEDGLNDKGLAIAFTSVYPKYIKYGLTSGLILRLLLEKCEYIEEAMDLYEQLPVASAQTYILADRNGTIGIIEGNAKKSVAKIIKESIGFYVTTNTFHLDGMVNENVQIKDVWQSETRYQSMRTYLEGNYLQMTKEQCKDLLSGKYGFVCQYDRRYGKDTVWSIFHESSQSYIEIANGNPSRVPYEKKTIAN